jgi:hypothetical protein
MSDVQDQFSKLAESTYQFHPSNPLPPPPTPTHIHTLRARLAHVRMCSYQPPLLPTVVTAAEPHQLVASGITLLLCLHCLMIAYRNASPPPTFLLQPASAHSAPSCRK